MGKGERVQGLGPSFPWTEQVVEAPRFRLAVAPALRFDSQLASKCDGADVTARLVSNRNAQLQARARRERLGAGTEAAETDLMHRRGSPQARS